MASDDERPEGPAASPHSHLVDFPEALEAFFTRLPELKALVGPGHADGVERVGERLRRALAARERGDVPAAMAGIVEAMADLSALVSAALPDEGPLMQAMAARFAQALTRGAVGDAKDAAEVMRQRSDSTVIPKKPR